MYSGCDADDDEAELADAKSIAELQTEISTLRAEIQALLHHNTEPKQDGKN